MSMNQLLGTTKRLLLVGLSTEEHADAMDKMNRAHTLMRRYEDAVGSVKELVKMCKAEGKKLRAIEDECNDLVEQGSRKAEVEVEVVLCLDPAESANDRIVVMRTDPGHEGEVVSSTALNEKQRAELEKGVLPGFENEPRLPADMVSELDTDPSVAAFVHEQEESESVASRVLGESAAQIGSVLDQIKAVAASYPKDEQPAKRKGGRPRKSTQMTLPVVSSTPSATTPSNSEVDSEPVVPADASPWNDLPAPGFTPPDEQSDSVKDRTPSAESVSEEPESEDDEPRGGDSEPDGDNVEFEESPSEPAQDVSSDGLTSGDSDDANAQEEAPPSESAAVQIVVPAPVVVLTDPASTETTTDDEPTPPTSRSTNEQTAHENRVASLMENAQAAKQVSADRAARKSAKTAAPKTEVVDDAPAKAPATDNEAAAKIVELNLSESLQAALTRMLVKQIEEAGSVTVKDLEAAVKAKLKSSTKPEYLTAIPFLLRIAAFTNPIASTKVDDADGWMRTN